MSKLTVLAVIIGIIILGCIAYTKVSERNSINDVLDFCMSNATTPQQADECTAKYKKSIE